MVFMCLYCRSHCLKGLMHGSSLNKTIITRFHFSLLFVLIYSRFIHLLSPSAVLAILFSQPNKVIKLLEAARGILSRLSTRMSSTASAPVLGEVDEEMAEVSSEEEEFDPPSATLLKAEGKVVVKRITTKKFRADPWPRVLESDLGEDEGALCSMLSRMKIEEKGKRMELITQRRTVTRSIEVQCELGGSGLLHLPRFDPSFPADAPSTSSFNVVTFVGDVEQQQPLQPSEDQQERTGAADVRIKDQQSGAIAKAQEEGRHTVSTPENLQITVPNKRKVEYQQDRQQQQSSSSKPAAPARKVVKVHQKKPQQQHQQQQPRDRRRQQQERQPHPQQQPMLTPREQKRASDRVIPLQQQINHQVQQRGRRHQQQRDVPQQRPAQGEKRRPPSRQSQQPSPAPKRRGNRRVGQPGNPPPQEEVPQPQLSRTQRNNRARKLRKADVRRRQSLGGAATPGQHEQLPESGSSAHDQGPGSVRPSSSGSGSVGPSGGGAAQSSREAPTGAGQGQGELAVNKQPANFSQRAGPRLSQPARSAAPPMTPNQVAPQVGRQQAPRPTVRMPAHPRIPSFPPPRPFVNTTILTLPTQSSTIAEAQIQVQAAPTPTLSRFSERRRRTFSISNINHRPTSTSSTLFRCNRWLMCMFMRGRGRGRPLNNMFNLPEARVL